MKEKKHTSNKVLDAEASVSEAFGQDNALQEENSQDDIEVLTDAAENPEVCEPESILEKKDKQIAELTDKWQRSLAEFDNFRKRTQKEKASMYNDGVIETITNLLPVIDNFERALDSNADSDSGFYKGVDMIYKQLQGYLRDTGVTEIPGTGESFDPNIHYAVTHVEDGAYGDNEVIDTLCKGYKFKDKVIRPAMVKVAN